MNYVFTVWDLCHRDHVEFPEVRQSFEFEARENLLKNALPKAVAVIAESPLGKKNIINRYGIDEKRVQWIPLSPANREFDDVDPKFNPFTAAKIPNTRYTFFILHSFGT